MARCTLLPLLLLCPVALLRVQVGAQLDAGSYDGCGDTRGCVGESSGCVEALNCSYLLTYAGVSGEDRYAFELTGLLEDEDKYVAVGLSGDRLMGEDAVVGCYQGEDPADPEDFAHVYWNTEDKDSVPLEEERAGLSGVEGLIEDGHVTCAFQMDTVTTFQDPSDNETSSSSYVFDLDSTPYYVHFAWGSLDTNGSDRVMTYHQDRAPGEELVYFSDYNPDYDFYGHVYDGCNDTKGCVGWKRNGEEDCVENEDCDFLATYMGISDEQYVFSVQGVVEVDDEAGNYVAMGISGDASMGQDSVTACGVVNGEGRVEMYWNTGIGRRTSLLQDDQSALSDYDVQLVNGVLSCRFTLLAEFSVEAPDDIYDFNLNSLPYYLLEATGSYDTENDPPVITYHGEDNRFRSLESQYLSEFNDAFSNTGFNFYNGCDDIKGCVGVPSGCVATRDCELAMSYAGVTADNYVFEALAKVDPTDLQYVAVGLSTDALMGDDNVVICRDLEDTASAVQAYYNDGKDGPVLLDDPDYGIVNPFKTKVEDILYCNFVRPADMEFEIPTDQGGTMEQHLSETPYHVLLAKGFLDDATNEPLYHENNADTRYATPEPVPLYEYNSFLDDLYQGCGDTKGCVGLPNGCVESSNCDLVLAYAGNEEGSYDFQMRGPLTDYIAFGLSRDAGMGDDSVIVCMAYNDGVDDIPPSVQMYYNFNSDSVPLDNATLGIDDDYIVTKQSSSLDCSFTRDASVAVPVPGTDEIDTFDLDAEAFYVLLAYGNVEDATGVITYHVDKQTSADEIFLGAYGSAGKAMEFYFGCGDSKGCYGFPTGCLNTTNCNAVLSYQGSSEVDYFFEVQGVVADRDYVALGLSQDGEAGDDAVFVCADGAEAPATTAYWYSDSHEVVPAVNQSVVGASETLREGDLIFCSFFLPSDFTLQTEQSSTLSLALNTGSYSLLLAQGNTNQAGELLEPQEREISEESFQLSEYNKFVGEGGYDGCQETKGCFGTTDGCVESRSCTGYTTYVMNDDGSVLFTMVGDDVPGNSYVSFALSEDNLMSEASVMYCFLGEDGLIQVVMAWTPQERDCIPLEDPQLGITEIDGSYEEGILTCSFVRAAVTEVPVPNSGEIVTFDLHDDYFFLAAFGPMDDQNPDPMKMGQHSERAAAGEASNLASFAAPSGAKMTDTKLHGSFMIIAWYLLGANGAFIARYGKRQFFGKKLFGKDVWFHLHRTTMVLTWALTLAAVFIMVAEFKFTPLDSLALDENPHALVGLVATGFMFLQPFLAMMRCHPGTRFRFVFDYVHSAIGLSALSLSFAAIYLSTDETFQQHKIPLDDGARTVSLVSFIALGAFHLVMTAYMLFDRHFGQSGSDSDKEVLEKRKTSRPDWFVLASMLAYFLLTLSVTIAMLVYIVDASTTS